MTAAVLLFWNIAKLGLSGVVRDFDSASSDSRFLHKLPL
jgi:hypothetical protein